MQDATQFDVRFHNLAKDRFSPHVYRKWIKDIKMILHLPGQSDDILQLETVVLDTYVFQVVQKHYLKELEQLVEEILETKRFSIKLSSKQRSFNFSPDLKPWEEQTAFREWQEINYFTEVHQFSNFILGASNQFAHAAAKAIVDEPGKCFNPLFIFGTSGLGKTHLIRAIGFEIKQRYPERRVRYAPSEQFMNDYLYYTKTNQISVFHAKYRSEIDVLLIDDIQFLATKDFIQEEFFYTFNALYEQNKQIVLTSDKIPKNLSGLEDRIRTRFEWGLIADIQPPEFETRIAIILSKVKQMDFQLSEDIIHFVATHFTDNVREMEGVVSKIFLFLKTRSIPPSVADIHSLLKPYLKGKPIAYGVDAILDTVAVEFGCQVKELKSAMKSRGISLPRHISMYLIRKYTEKTYPQIGELVGGKDHTTVIHGVKRVSKLLSESLDFRKQMETIEEKLRKSVV
jgi:chromosomal replication initiator protein